MANFSTTALLHAIRQIPASIITSSEKYLLIIILSCLNSENTTWHSTESLAAFACLGVRTVHRHMKVLEQKGLISIDRPTHYTHHVTNTYSLNTEQILSFSVDKSVVKMTSDVNIGSQNDYQHEKSVVKMTSETQSRRSKWHTKKESFKKEIKEKKERESFFDQSKSKAKSDKPPQKPKSEIDRQAQMLRNSENMQKIRNQLKSKMTYKPKEGSKGHGVLETE